MSKQLYQIYYGSPGGGEDVQEKQLDAYLEVEALKKCGVLISVEPCDHGRIDRHKVRYIESALGDVTYGDWCEGAGLETDIE